MDIRLEEFVDINLKLDVKARGVKCILLSTQNQKYVTMLFENIVILRDKQRKKRKQLKDGEN